MRRKLRAGILSSIPENRPTAAIENAEYARLKAATDWLAQRCAQGRDLFSKADTDAILTLLRSFGRGQTPLDPRHCYLCDRPKRDCACVVED